MKKIRSIFGNTFLVVLSLLLCVGGAEAVLRVFCPQYKYAALSQKMSNRTRIYANIPNATEIYKSPDSDQKHIVHFNSLGLRQNRDFLLVKPENVVRIGFLGDSYTANLRMPVEYSFTEPLDFMLNASGIAAEVLNFGVDGYGPDQELLQLEDEVLLLKPDYVFYVYCSNDIRNVLENKLYKIDRSGELQYIPYDQSLTKDILKNFYLTYFVYDILSRMGLSKNSSPLGTSTELVQKLCNEMFYNLNTNKYIEVENDFIQHRETELTQAATALFAKLVIKMKNDCINNGTQFSVILLPGDNKSISSLLQQSGVDYYDLTFDFENYKSMSVHSTKFKNDGHWNEEGNKVAAEALYRYIAKKMQIRDAVNPWALLGMYYAALPNCRVSQDGLVDVPLPVKDRERLY